MPTNPVAPVAAEYTITLTFAGGDVGEFPASLPSNPAVTIKANTCRFGSGEDFVDVSAAMDRVALNRISKSNPSLMIGLPLRVPSNLLAEYQEHGPLVQVVVTADNLSDGSGANFTFTFKGIMARPGFDFLSNPGITDLQINAYGLEPTLAQVGL